MVVSSRVSRSQANAAESRPGSASNVTTPSSPTASSDAAAPNRSVVQLRKSRSTGAVSRTPTSSRSIGPGGGDSRSRPPTRNRYPVDDRSGIPGAPPSRPRAFSQGQIGPSP